MTHDVARQRILLGLELKPGLTGNKEEDTAKCAKGYRGNLTHNWHSYERLQAKTKRYNPPRQGSSRGKIGRAIYTGFKEFYKRFGAFVNSLHLS